MLPPVSLPIEKPTNPAAVAAPGPALERMAQRQRGPDDLFIGEDALVAIDQRRLVGTETGSGIDQCMKDGLFRPADIERHDFFAGRCGDARDAQCSTPVVVLTGTILRPS